MRSRIGAIEHAIEKLLLNLSRLARISESISTLGSKGISWTGPAHRLLKPRHPTSATGVTRSVSCSTEVQPRNLRNVPILRDLQPLPSPLLDKCLPILARVHLPRPGASVLSVARIRSQLHEGNIRVHSRDGAMARSDSQHHLILTVGRVARDAIVRFPISRHPVSNGTDGKSRFVNGDMKLVRRRYVGAVPPFCHDHSRKHKLGSIVLPVNTATRRFLPSSPFQTFPAADPKKSRSVQGKDQDVHGRKATPEGGDLYLESSILRRWLFQSLDREVVRPRSGIIAVDPRVTPPWAGPSFAT